MGVRSSITSTYTPCNHQSALSHADVVNLHIEKELSAHRYTGPFSRDRLELIIGPFRSSPLGTVEKAGSSNEFRIIQDLSYPRNNPSIHSVNSEIDMSDFTCGWGTFYKVSDWLMDAPKGSQAATLDVSAAFRCCPIRPDQQIHFVISWNNLFYIDHNAPFGASSSGGVFGQIADAFIVICKANKITQCTKWVDDFLFLRSPIPSSLPHLEYPFSLDDIYNLSAPLGLPWKASKTRPFASSFLYLGFMWDLDAKTVQIPHDKKLKYIRKLEPWQHTPNKFTLHNAQSLLGTLVHCTLAITDGRSRLPALTRFVSSFSGKSPFSTRTPNSSTLRDIAWWHDQFSLDFCGSDIQRPPPLSTIPFFVDASTSWGIGIIFDGAWSAWQLLDGWRSDGREIGWAEMIAVELGVRLAIHLGFRDIHFEIRSDNAGVIGALEAGKSRGIPHNFSLQRITCLMRTYGIWLTMTYVPTKDNPADLPSRGVAPTLPIPPHKTSFDLPDTLIDLIALDTPHLR